MVPFRICVHFKCRRMEPVGSDNLFHKRKAKSVSDLNRASASKATYAKILIVCEGEKTEPYYFQEMIDYYKIHTANVHISGECGSDPVNVVQHGFNLFKKEKEAKEGPFDHVYFVIDRDAHNNYQQALEMINRSQHNKIFRVANSIPSFEYWLLLHFGLTTAPYSAVGGVSSGAAVLKALKVYMPKYAKASRGTFKELFEKLEGAKKNAELANAEAIANKTDNPSTYVHHLVTFLQKIKPK